VGWDWRRELDAVELLEDSSPLQTNVLVRVMGFSVDGSPFAHRLMHGIGT